MRLLFISLLFVVGVFLSLPRNFLGYHLPGIWWNFSKFSVNRDLTLKQGLDLAGGSSITFEADMGRILPEDRQRALEAARETVSRRVNLFGVSESVVRTYTSEHSYRITVELPGVYDPSEAVSLIGKTADLEFWELKNKKDLATAPDATDSALSFEPTELTGADLKRARVDFDRKSGKPAVALQFNKQGAKKFEEITKRNVGKPLAILLDGKIVTSPVVQQIISGGNALITGNFSLDEAKRLTIQLNSGSLPVPLRVIEQRSIGASLGERAIKGSIFAGVVGISVLVLFMLLYYRFLGIFAVLGLLFYGVLTVALYKLFPVVLTLPGIAGFILSLGMAVDTNILVFERIKEASRDGEPWIDSIKVGFERAWSSIRDANVATLFIVFVLFNPLNLSFLHTSGPVRGFALTLGIGVLLSLFTGLFVVKTLMEFVASKRIL